MIPVVELLRVSTDLQAENDGLPAQHAVNVRTCSQFGLNVVQTVEIVESGTTVAKSPQMASVLGSIASGRARGIVLAEYSRLFRPDRWDDMVVLQTFSDNDAHIYLPSGPIDLQSELGFVQATVNNLLAAMERRRIKERMHRGKEEHRRKGEHVAGGIGMPFGLSYSRDSGWGYTSDIEMVRELFRRFLGGERNYTKLARDLSLPRSNVRFILENPVYTGWRIYDEKRDARQKLPSGDKRKVQRADADIIRVRLPLEPVVSEADFQTVQQLIEELREPRAVRFKTSQLANEFLYRGYIVCGDCGLRIYGDRRPQNGKMAYYYYCKSFHHARRPKGTTRCGSGFMVREKLEAELDMVMSRELANEDFLLRALSKYHASQADEWRSMRVDTSAVEQKISALNTKRTRILESFFEGVITRDERDQRLAPIATETAKLQLMLAEAPAAPTISENAIIELVNTFAEWPVLQRDERRSVLEAFEPRFHINKYVINGVDLPLRNENKGQPLSNGWQRSNSLYIPLSA